jgi:site-specific DNA-cytosine methylase
MENNKWKYYGSLFTGGGGLDLGLERAGFECRFMVENDKACLELLGQKWPHVPKNEIRPVMGIVGGDPCPNRSTMAAIKGTSKPDMAGYFLAMAQRIEPGWILRENVPSPDVVDFAAACTALGYSVICIELSAESFTATIRKRQFILATTEKSTLEKFESVFIQASIKRLGSSSQRNQPPVNSLTTRGKGRNTYNENYVFEKRNGLRVLTIREREFIQGFPPGWTKGLSRGASERILGNAVIVPVAEFIGKAMFKALEPGD